MELQSIFRRRLDAHIAAVNEMHNIIPEIFESIVSVISCLDAGGKILICGNGGSAADAQHIAAEFVVKFSKRRIALPAIALTVDSSVLLAAGNDFDFSHVFSRQVEALGNNGDLLIAISTSGQSANVNLAIEVALQKNMSVIVLTGQRCNVFVDGVFYLVFPHHETSIVQEMHQIYYHLLCEAVDDIS